MKPHKYLLALIFALSLVLSACSTEPVAAAPADAPSILVEAPDIGLVTVTFIDVGQGDSTLIQTENAAMLIDGGVRTAYPKISEILRREGISRLDYVIATHPHADHIGGLVPLIDSDNGIGIGTVIMPNLVHTTRTYENFLAALIDNQIDVQEPYPGKTLELDSAVFTIIAPNSSGYGNLNNYSIVMIMDHGDSSFLFAADAESDSEREILENFEDISADVLRVGHHGSRTSTSEEFLDAISPRYAVISAGADNQYGHPHHEVLDRLNRRGVYTLRTCERGNIEMVSGADGIRISWERTY
ncbi:MAG: MBL fold metallo-hydrolase [Defluviitaleaceae bacterium]|nr:MBL fold metallo-hydrolase [Defluviitaleaceae bacterium]